MHIIIMGKSSNPIETSICNAIIMAYRYIVQIATQLKCTNTSTTLSMDAWN